MTLLMPRPLASSTRPLILKLELVTARQTENGDVLLFKSVVVAVTT